MIGSIQYPKTRYSLFMTVDYYPDGGYSDFVYGFNSADDFRELLDACYDGRKETEVYHNTNKSLLSFFDGNTNNYLDVFDNETRELFYGFNRQYEVFIVELEELLRDR